MSLFVLLLVRSALRSLLAALSCPVTEASRHSERKRRIVIMRASGRGLTICENSQEDARCSSEVIVGPACARNKRSTISKRYGPCWLLASFQHSNIRRSRDVLLKGQGRHRPGIKLRIGTAIVFDQHSGICSIVDERSGMASQGSRRTRSHLVSLAGMHTAQAPIRRLLQPMVQGLSHHWR